MFSGDVLPEDVCKVYSWTPEVALSTRVAHFVGPDATAPVRHLPPGKPITLFWQLKAWTSAIQTFHGQRALRSGPMCLDPSWSTFWRSWTKWSDIMKFRPRSQHKECNQCFDFRCQLSKANCTYQEKMKWASEFQEHLRAQYHDRLIYWSLRFASRCFQNVLCIIIDGMDKVKTAWPQYRDARKPAYLDALHRPRVILSVVICHG